ncbi:MAG: Mur ligase family protein [Candidatus Gastranaerophilales bacterium]|nr:Mur ligase family protein [Candidatus Gastranaerophilales bacterium]
MGKIKFYLSILAAKVLSLLIITINRSSGTSFVGLVVLKICPDFLSYCSKYVKKEIITVTGTNGKTTTAGLISSILEGNGQKVIHNEKGANMLTGVANALSLEIMPFKRFDYYVLESDEAYLTNLYDFLPSDYLLITNLFRDQLDRYGELDTTAKKIQEAIDKNPKLKLILNGDDPMVTNLGTDRDKIFFGFDKVEIISNSIVSHAPIENVNCPVCKEALKYAERFFAQQGHYYCDCGYRRPQCEYSGDVKIFDDYSIIKVYTLKGDFEFKFGLIGLYNAYNALAAISLGLELGYDENKIQAALNSYQAIFGRAEKLTLRGHQVLIQLIKNPTGASEVLKTVDLTSNILIIINDNYADGRDVSWLWDADFEFLKDIKNKITVSGDRAKDMAVRLKYAGIEPSKISIIPQIDDAIEYLLNSLDINEKITILPTYTALLKMQRGKWRE